MPKKINKKQEIKSNSAVYEIYLGTFIDNEFTWYSVAKYGDPTKAYKEFKAYVNTQLKYTDEELKKVWDTGRLDVELRLGNKLLNWVGIYSREVKNLSEKEEKEAEKGKGKQKKKVKDSISVWAAKDGKRMFKIADCDNAGDAQEMYENNLGSWTENIHGEDMVFDMEIDGLDDLTTNENYGELFPWVVIVTDGGEKYELTRVETEEAARALCKKFDGKWIGINGTYDMNYAYDPDETLKYWDNEGEAE